MSLTELLNDEELSLLNNAQSIRERIVDELTKDQLPSDKNSQNFLIKALDGLDRSLYTKAKLQVDDKNAKTNSDTAKLIAEVLSKHTITSGNRNSLPELTIDIKPDNIVEGELDIGYITLTEQDIK